MRVFAAVGLSISLAAGPCFADCGFQRAFHRRDKAGTYVVAVYEGRADPALGGERPLAFVTDLAIHTDDTPISFSVQDPRGETLALADLRDALRPGAKVDDLQALAAAGWPTNRTWRVLSEDAVERNAINGKPCFNPEGYLMARTALGSDPLALERLGDCDASKWIDGREVPSLVLPRGVTGFTRRDALPGSLAIAMTLEGPRRLGYGLVGDTGPANEMGAASVAFNRQLNSLPPEANPSDRTEALAWFHVPRSVVVVFPGDGNRASFPVDGERVEAEARAKFEAWGGAARLSGCLAELGI